jgi:hypothetical protein
MSILSKKILTVTTHLKEVEDPKFIVDLATNLVNVVTLKADISLTHFLARPRHVLPGANEKD